MRLLKGLALASGLAIAAAMSPALAQQDHGQGAGGMMGQKDGMMGQAAPDAKGDREGMMECPMMAMMMSKGMMDHAMMHSVPMMEGRLAYIKADLGITETQTSAWNAYADAIRAHHAAMESAFATLLKTKESGSAVERLDARIKAAEAKLDGLKALKAPTEALYAVLSDDQKKKADQLLSAACGMK